MVGILTQQWLPHTSLNTSLSFLQVMVCGNVQPTTSHSPFHVSAPRTPTPFNYALKQCGAEVVLDLTSTSKKISSVVPPPDSELRVARRDDDGAPPPGTVPPPLKTEPSYAIDGNLDTPRCWEFDGHFGQLGFILVSMLNVSSLTIAHYQHVAVQSAPRSIILWGLVDGQDWEDSYWRNIDLRRRLNEHLPQGISPPPSTDDIYTPLAFVEYNPYLDTNEQSFPVFKEVEELGFPIGIVIVQILSNWGSTSTSLCHVGVHGLPMDLDT